MAVTTAHRQLDATGSRSLTAIQMVIQEALNHTGHGEFRRVDLECEGDAVTISGRVPTYYLKQLVQSIALAAPGVGRVSNELLVWG